MLNPEKSPLFYGWVIVIICWLANFVTSPMNPVVFSMFMDPMTEDLNISRANLAWVFTIRQALAGLTAPLMGRLVDRYGARWIGVASGIFAGALLFGIFFVHNVVWVYILFGATGLTGLATFGANILSQVPVANWFIAKRGRAVALAGTGIGAGTAVLVPISQLVIHTIGWRWAWVGFGILTWVVMIPTYGLFMRRKPEDVGLLPDGIKEQTGTNSGNSTIARPQLEEVNFTLKQAIRTKVFWFVVFGLLIYMFASSPVLLYRVSFWNELGISPGAIAFGVALDPFTVIFSVMIFGFLAEHFHLRFMAAAGGFWRGISGIPLLVRAARTSSMLIHNVTWGIGSGGYSIVQQLIFPDYFGREHQGAIRGFAAPFMIAGGALGGPLLGYFVDTDMGFNFVWIVCLFGMLLPGLAFSFMIPPQLKESDGNQIPSSHSDPATSQEFDKS